jgi:hypothetical protein
MPTYAIEDFKQGMDLRRSYTTAPAGSLRVLRNCFITAGAEIEKRAAFVLFKAAPLRPELPTQYSSQGVISRNGLVYTVGIGPGSITEPSGPTDVGVVYLPLSVYDISQQRVFSWQLFNGEFYIVMREDATGKYQHYYKQKRVTDSTPGFNPDLQDVSAVRVYGLKMYGLSGETLRFSAINDPTQWNPPPSTTADGSGYLHLSSQDSDSTDLSALEVYYSQMAIFSRRTTQFWSLAADSTQNAFRQLLRHTGCIAASTAMQFGNGDIMYLSSSGVRSLRVQNISLTAGTTDVGTPIDELMRQLMITNGEYWFYFARTMIQPRTGRLFIMLPDRVLVLSTFQEPPITAWSYFDAPFGFDDCCVADPYLMFRGTDGNLYQYGGPGLNTYDTTEAEVITPALACNSPSTNKIFHGFDVGAQGTWTLSVGCDPNNQATEETVATFTGATYVNPQMTMPESSTHISLRFRSTDASQARIGHAIVLFDEGLRD